MITELSREDFMAMIASNPSLEGAWLAVHVFVPTEWLHELGYDDSRNDQMIAYGRIMLNSVQSGYFARIGWSSFFCLTQMGELDVRAILGSEKKRLESDDPDCKLWQFSVSEISSRSTKDVFAELEWRSLEVARKDRLT